MDGNVVAGFIDDLRIQFRTFGEGLQLLNDKVDNLEKKVDTIDNKVGKLEIKLDGHIKEDRQEHHQLMEILKRWILTCSR